ncbi:MAG: GNAT family N-acetyltransferase [Caldilineaceae bacterium]
MTTFQLTNLRIDALTEEQRTAVFQLTQQHCFGDVPSSEIEEDFFTESVSRVMCYQDAQLVSCAGTKVRPILFEGKPLLLGGIAGVCTHLTWRGQGVATQICTAAMDFLAEAKCDVVFLSTSPMARRLYEKLGFRPVPRFSWENIHGQVKQGDNGMVAPICSPEVAERMWQGDHILHVGRGYW